MKMQFVQPQLARPWDEKRDVELLNNVAYTIEPKLDGHRVAVIRHAGGVLLLSRRNKQVQHIEWLEGWALNLPVGTYLDGELVAQPGTSSHNVHSLRASGADQLSYVAFDLLWHEGHCLISHPWARRRRFLETLDLLPHQWPPTPAVPYLIETYPHQGSVQPYSIRVAIKDAWLAAGYEGLMYKRKDAPYMPNSRSAWIKQKVSMVARVLIVGCDGQPSKWRVRPGHVGTDGVMYPDGLHTDPWIAGHVNLEYGYGPVDQLDSPPFGARLKNVPGVGLCTVAGTLGVTGTRTYLQGYVGKVATVKCWGVYLSGTLRHPSPQRYEKWDGGPVEPPVETLI